MDAQVPVRVVLDITRTRSTIAGQLALDGAPASSFYGWLELINSIERVAGPVLEPRQGVDVGERACER